MFLKATSCRNMETCSTEVHGGGGLELAKVACEPVSSRPKPCASLKNAPEILPVRRSLLALVHKSAFPSEPPPVRASYSCAQGFTLPLARRLWRCPLLLPNLVLTRPIERATARSRVLRRPTRLFAPIAHVHHTYRSISIMGIKKEVCVCVCVFSSHSFWTSSSLDVPAGVTQEEGHTGFLVHLLSAVRALIFLARRIQPFLSLVDREVEFCVLTI